jgi:hypothetical protein
MYSAPRVSASEKLNKTKVFLMKANASLKPERVRLLDHDIDRLQP